MGIVYEAENVFTKRRVAIKWLSTTAPRGQSRQDRLLREAQAASRIHHRNVVDVYDVGFAPGAIFLVMQLLRGETLATFLETKVVSVPVLLRLLLPAMRGVAEAHRQGVIHRDVKPENIFLAREVDQDEPVAKILDFGIAKLEHMQSLTTSGGHALGTPMFMSLEQLRGDRDLDGRVDVYGFGVILYMALTGTAPYPGTTLAELAEKVATSSAPSLQTLRTDLPRALVEVVTRAIARERSDRTSSMEALIRELSPFASEDEYLRKGEAVAETICARVSRVDDLADPDVAAAGMVFARQLPPTASATQDMRGERYEESWSGAVARIDPALWRSWRRAIVVPLAALIAAIVAVAVQSIPARERSRAEGRPLDSALPAMALDEGAEGRAERLHTPRERSAPGNASPASLAGEPHEREGERVTPPVRAKKKMLGIRTRAR